MSASTIVWKTTAKRVLGPARYRALVHHYVDGREWLRVGAPRWLAETRWRYGPGRRAAMRRLRALHNAYAGQRCFVIGNGPSLRNTDLRRLKGEVTIGCNGLFLLFDEMGFLPTFYTVEDQLVAEDRAAAINTIQGTIKVFPRDLSYCLSQDEDTVYIDFVRDYDDFPKFSAKFDQMVYWGGTVTFLNLQLAYHIGCREVYLIGIDHTYHVPSYIVGDTIVSREPDVNHFHPDYFGPGYRWHDPMVDRMETAYRAARSYFEANGGTIYNATIGGQLEVFARRTLEEVTS